MVTSDLNERGFRMRHLLYPSPLALARCMLGTSLTPRNGLQPLSLWHNQLVWRFASDSSQQLPILTLYTKHPCSLCDDAKGELEPLSHQFTLKEVDITEPANKEWFKKYRYDIPVFHFEGEFLMKHKADINALQDALDKFNNRTIS
ncbi:glutaredoxin-like protein C5orf63 homolog [Haliotis rubra]|uniref:glutaredoxin-like protein C5orf63 homolog n=1 Tax=Haliotis rubra TaxID=36100 RepID=UPI001EE50B83|nr:glutaredoxin-like protein C5orf63 homolog [Haliotis rubra]